MIGLAYVLRDLIAFLLEWGAALLIALALAVGLDALERFVFGAALPFGVSVLVLTCLVAGLRRIWFRP